LFFNEIYFLNNTLLTATSPFCYQRSIYLGNVIFFQIITTPAPAFCIKLQLLPLVSVENKYILPSAISNPLFLSFF